MSKFMKVIDQEVKFEIIYHTKFTHTVIYMASGINFYSEILISLIHIADINNSKC